MPLQAHTSSSSMVTCLLLFATFHSSLTWCSSPLASGPDFPTAKACGSEKPKRKQPSCFVPTRSRLVVVLLHSIWCAIKIVLATASRNWHDDGCGPYAQLLSYPKVPQKTWLHEGCHDPTPWNLNGGPRILFRQAVREMGSRVHSGNATVRSQNEGMKSLD